MSTVPPNPRWTADEHPLPEAGEVLQLPTGETMTVLGVSRDQRPDEDRHGPLIDALIHRTTCGTDRGIYRLYDLEAKA